MPLMDIITGRRRRALISSDWTSHLQDPDLAQLQLSGDWTSSGGVISSWTDASGNGRAITFPVTRRPTDNTTYATFNGTSDAGTNSPHMADAGGVSGCQMHIVLDNYSEGAIDSTIMGEFDSDGTPDPFYQAMSTSNTVDNRALFVDDSPAFIGAIGNNHVYNFGWSSDPRVFSFIDFDTHFALFVNGYFQAACDIDRAGGTTLTPNVMSWGARNRFSNFEKFVNMDLYQIVASHTDSFATFEQHVNLLGSEFGIDVAQEQELDHANVVVSGSCSDNSVAGNIAVESDGVGVGHAYIPFAGTGTGANSAGCRGFKVNSTNAGSIEFQYADDVSGTNGSAYWSYSSTLASVYFGGKTQNYSSQNGIRVRLNNNAGGAVSISNIRIEDAAGLP